MTIEELLLALVWFSIAIGLQVGIIVFLVWLFRKRKVWGLIRMGITGHGSLIEKIYSDGSIEHIPKKDVLERVEWDSVDPISGSRSKDHTGIVRVFHRLKGTGIPVHVCPATYPTNINVLEKVAAQLNVSEVNLMGKMQYARGQADMMLLVGKKGNVDKLILLMLFIGALFSLISALMGWQVLGALNPVKPA